ncbi:hypothetical protein GWI33_008292 [Rhynchophorus ferrugineus]|uniref:Uncharacterized protein n=1 Tax=Rhynchophorus ferrugineus TaxID=354439 RepID=A0A834MJB2_RHYFE|nr:hypothetical protein GWI33_008292 [Rhynchophorus ferrugineus]
MGRLSRYICPVINSRGTSNHFNYLARSRSPNVATLADSASRRKRPRFPGRSSWLYRCRDNGMKAVTSDTVNDSNGAAWICSVSERFQKLSINLVPSI